MIPSLQRPAVTAVISTHNRRDELETTLTGLRQLGYPHLQVVVVDNASDDGTATLLRSDFPRVTLIPHSDNRPMRGYNMGFDSVRTPYVLVLDDDSCPQRGAIERMVEILEDHPDVGAVAANIVGPGGQSEWGAEGDVGFSTDFFNLIGCGFLARRGVLLQTGGYDESFGLYYNDLELALRILSFGHRIAYDRTAIVEHRKGTSSPSPLKLHYMMRNFPLLVRSHFSGLRRTDLVLGHAAIALCHAIRNGQGRAALRGLKAIFFSTSRRAFLPAPDTLAVRRFVHRYSLWSHLLRKRPPRPPAASSPILSPALPLQQVPPPPNADAPETGDESVLSWYSSPWPDYQWHLRHVAYLSPANRLSRVRQAAAWPYRPLVSILTPVYKTNPAHLAECLLSVERQIYPRWELCIVDDGSGLPELNRIIEDFACRHPGQVRFISRLDNRGIAPTSQEALELATGEFIGLLDHDDRLAPEALWEVVARLQLHPDADWIYSDNDKISPDGDRWYYHFKPDWSPDLFSCTNYALHFSAVRRELAIALGGFRKEFEGSQDYDLYLRVSEKARRIEHVSRILYSWRESPSSVARDLGNKPYAFEAGRRALAAALARRGQSGTVEDSSSAWIGNFRIRRPLPADSVAVLWLGHDSTSDPSSTPWLRQAGEVSIFRIFQPASGETQGQALARAMSAEDISFLLVVDSRSAPESSSTLADMLRTITAPGVAALAPKIVLPDQTVDHCGLSFAPGGRLVFPLRGLPAADAAYGAYGALPRNVAALSPVAVLLHTARLRDVSTPDPAMDPAGILAAACLDARAKGLRIVADGGIRALFHAPPFAPGSALEPGGRYHVQLAQRHPSLFVGGDPFYNCNLRTSPPDFGVWHEALHD